MPRFARRFSVVTEELAGFPVHVITPRHLDPARTVLHLHGGGYMAPADPFHLVYVARLATALRARIVLPDYPLAPEHTWRDSFEPLTGLAARWAGDSRLTLFGDSAGGGYALALAQALRDRGGPQPSELLLFSPWVDLTTSTPDTPAYDAVDPWLFLGKVRAYAAWWAGSPEDLGRPEVSPGLADLDGLPRALMFCGTRDLLLPGCRLLAERAADVRLGPHLRRGARPAARLPAAAAGPRGPPRLAHHEGVPPMIRAVAVPFDSLDASTAYDVWRLRQDVFVVEQGCPYPDLDGRDPEPGTRHVLLHEDETLIGYARVLDDGREWRIGRVVLARAGRGRGLADVLMHTALQVCPGRDVVLDAQSPLAAWYTAHGFVVDGDEFLEDGIPHVPMRRPRE